MKNKFLIFFSLIVTFTMGQTPAPSGTWYKNAAEKTKDEIKGVATFDSNNILNGYLDIKSDLESLNANPNNYIDDFINGNNLSYKYLSRNGTGLNVVYVYGNKAISYTIVKDVNSVYSWIGRIYLCDLDANGFPDYSSPEELARNVQEFAIRYRVSGSSGDDNWLPYHGTNSINTTLISESINIDGISYSNYNDLPLDSPVVFDNLLLKQKIGGKYNVSDPTYQIEVTINTSFDNSQLHFNNEYLINEDLDVNRFYGSRLSAEYSQGLTTNTGDFIASDNSNTVINFGYNTTSNLISANNVFAINHINGLADNTSYGKTFFNPQNTISIFNRSTGSQTLYYNLTPFLPNDTYTKVLAGEKFNSSNNIMYVPKNYGQNDIDVNIPISDGLSRMYNYDSGGGSYTPSTSILLNGTSFERAELTGDVTASQNSNETTIANGAVTNAKMATMNANTFKGRLGTSGEPEDLTATQMQTALGLSNYLPLSGGTLTGNLNFTSMVISENGSVRFRTSGANTVFSGASGGNIYLRPNGDASTVGQIQVLPSGVIQTTTGNSGRWDLGYDYTQIGHVPLSGNSTISGVKTFSSSPIVPNPTTNTQVANKIYVDNAISSASVNYGSQNQIPFMNATNNGFDYSNNISYNSVDNSFRVSDGTNDLLLRPDMLIMTDYDELDIRLQPNIDNSLEINVPLVGEVEWEKSGNRTAFAQISDVEDMISEIQISEVLKSISGWNPSVTQVLESDGSGNIVWVDK